MRIKLLVASCLLAVVFLAIALRGSWGSATADDGTRFELSVHGVTHVRQATRPRAAIEHCSFLTGRGAVEYCAPAPEGDASFSMLCSVFPLIFSGLLLALASGLLTYFSPHRARGRSAALAAASLAAVFTGTVVAQISMSRALEVFDEIPFYLGGVAFTSAWIAMGLLLFAAALSTTTSMLGHD